MQILQCNVNILNKHVFYPPQKIVLSLHFPQSFNLLFSQQLSQLLNICKNIKGSSCSIVCQSIELFFFSFLYNRKIIRFRILITENTDKNILIALTGLFLRIFTLNLNNNTCGLWCITGYSSFNGNASPARLLSYYVTSKNKT